MGQIFFAHLLDENIARGNLMMPVSNGDTPGPQSHDTPVAIVKPH
jgi:hypothetical protein